MWYEADIDALMKRTASRPLPAGRMDRQTALHFGVGLGFFSVLLMGVATNWFAAAILAVSILFYVLVYTVWLKRRTPQNIVIGGAAGAFPPLIGWAAATGDVDAAAAAAVRAHLPVDAAAFLGAVAVRPLRLCHGRRADAAGRRRARRRRGSRSCSTPCRWPRRRSRPGRSASPARSTASPRPRSASSSSLLVAAGARQPRDRAGGDEAGEAPVRFLDPLSVRDVRRAGRRPVAGRMTPRDRGRDPPPPARAARSSWRWLLGAFVVLVYRDHHRQDERATDASLARRNGAPPCSPPCSSRRWSASPSPACRSTASSAR